MAGKKRKPSRAQRDRKRQSREANSFSEAKRARVEIPVEIGDEGETSDIVIDDTDDDQQPNGSGVSASNVVELHDDHSNDSSEDVIYLPPDLNKWCSDNRIPHDYEKTLIGVEYCGIEKVFSLIDETRLKHPKLCKKLESDVWAHFAENGQNKKIYEWKMKVRDILLRELSMVFCGQKVSLFAVGSTMNGCGSFNSDMDLCFCVPDIGDYGVEFSTHRNKTLKTLHKIQGATRRSHDLKKLIMNAQVIPAKVPILKLDLHPPYSELDVDIGINNIAGVYNSHLLHYYSSIDTRFPALCLIIKHWAIRNNISDAMNGTFNSYSLILLVLHYLQCAVKPAILPNLQYLFPDLFSNTVALEQLCLFQELKGMPERPANLMSIGDLLMGFFHYYDNFDFDIWAISIRSGKRFPRSVLNSMDARYYIFIEEPFDMINTARCVTKDYNFRDIKKAIHEASQTFSKRKPEISSIGVIV